MAGNPEAEEIYEEEINRIRVDTYYEEFRRRRREAAMEIDRGFSAGRSWWVWIWEFLTALVGSILSFGRRRGYYAIDVAGLPRPSGDLAYPVLPQLDDSEEEIKEILDEIVDQAIEEVEDEALAYRNVEQDDGAEVEDWGFFSAKRQPTWRRCIIRRTWSGMKRIRHWISCLLLRGRARAPSGLAFIDGMSAAVACAGWS